MSKIMELEKAAQSAPNIFETSQTSTESMEFEIKTGWKAEDAESFFQETRREEQAFKQGGRSNGCEPLGAEDQVNHASCDSGWTLAAIAEIRREMRLFPGRP